MHDDTPAKAPVRTQAQSVPGVPTTTPGKAAPNASPTIRITIDGEALDVVEGATVLAALASREIGGTRVSVSGEPRTALCGMGVCQECRVTIDGRAHRLACQTLCRDGQTIRTMEPR